MKLARSLLVATSITLLTAGGATPSAWAPGPAGWTSGPVRHLRTVPVETGGAVGATLHEGYLYVTSFRSISIYDVSVPTSPSLVSITPLPQAINEGPATNGEILLTMQDLPSRLLRIFDVTNKAAPREIATFNPAPLLDHIWACVLDCAFAYGSGGSILDLSNPAAPVRVGNWRDVAPTRGVHGIGEVAPGLVFTGSLPQYMLDARTDPAAPAVVASVDPPTTRFTGFRGVNSPAESPVSYVAWPRGTKARHALSTLETPFSGPCNESSGGLVVFDTHQHRKSGRFTVSDVYRITTNGLPSEGLAPENAIGCGALDLDPNPLWNETGLVAVGWAEHGVRLLRVSKKGTISEVGGFLGHGTEAFAPVWVTPTVLYSIDTSRGIDVLEVA
ncbi:MAG TPA: hypothetical protein VEA19_07270 [Actinomycetota bacterium]|nr:hypothetical protein [Actinomycetota bacterium]